MIFGSTDKNKEVLKHYGELWEEINNQTETINGSELNKYKKYFRKISFESDNKPLGKKLSIPSMIIATRNVFQENF